PIDEKWRSHFSESPRRRAKASLQSPPFERPKSISSHRGGSAPQGKRRFVRPRAASSHSTSVGSRFPAALQKRSAPTQLTSAMGAPPAACLDRANSLPP